MARFINRLQALSVICAALILLFALAASAAPADKNGTPEASEPKDAGKDGAGKPDEDAKDGDADTSKDEGKPDEAPADAKAEEAPPAPAAGGIQSAVKMKDLLAEGFLIRTTVLVPADAVTRQLGKVSPDAIILTLQKETAIAVCYYTLKAYVKESLTDIASCTAFR
jgi:hypothetical protein